MSTKLIQKLKNLKHLGLKSDEVLILSIFLEAESGNDYTPLELSKLCSIPRASIYNTLALLQKRGFVKKVARNKRSLWRIDNLTYLVNNSSVATEHKDEDVKLYAGKDQVKKVVFQMLENRKDERFMCFSAYGDLIYKGWLKIFTEEELNLFNDKVKKQKLICELVAPNNWLEDHYRDLGIAWGESFFGRTASGVYLDKKYFNFSAQIFAFHDVIYLLSPNDKLVLEIRNKNLYKMLMAMFNFIQERGTRIDVNERLQKMMIEDH